MVYMMLNKVRTEVRSVAGLFLSFVLEVGGLVARLIGLAFDEIRGIVDLALRPCIWSFSSANGACAAAD